MADPATNVISLSAQLQAEKWITEANDTASTARRTVFLWILAAGILFAFRIVGFPLLVNSLELYFNRLAPSASLLALDQELELYTPEGELSGALKKTLDVRVKRWLKTNQTPSSDADPKNVAPTVARTREKQGVVAAESAFEKKAANEAERLRERALTCVSKYLPRVPSSRSPQPLPATTPAEATKATTACDLFNSALQDARNQAIRSKVRSLSEEPFKLPGDINFNLNAYFQPAALSACLVLLMYYALDRRRICFRLIFRAIQKMENENSPVAGAALMHKLNPLPWWMAPTPSRDSKSAATVAFAQATRLPFSSARVVSAFVVLSSVALFSGYAAYKAAFFVDHTLDPTLAFRLSGVPVRDILKFALRCVLPICVLELGALFYLWRSFSRARLLAAPASGGSFFPLDRRAWLLSSGSIILPPLLLNRLDPSKSERNPRFRTRTVNSSGTAGKRPESRSRLIREWEESIRQDLMSMAPDKVFDVHLHRIKSVDCPGIMLSHIRILDRLAVLTLEHSLTEKRKELVAAVKSIAQGTIQSSAEPGTVPAEGARRLAMVQPGPASVSKSETQSILSRLILGVPRSPALGPSPRRRGRCRLQPTKESKWIPRESEPQPESAKLARLLEHRIQAWSNDNSKWHTRRTKPWGKPAPVKKGTRNRQC